MYLPFLCNYVPAHVPMAVGQVLSLIEWSRAHPSIVFGNEVNVVDLVGSGTIARVMGLEICVSCLIFPRRCSTESVFQVYIVNPLRLAVVRCVSVVACLCEQG